MNLFSELVSFLKDGSLSFGKKSIIIIFFFFMLVALNYFFGFSFNYSINQELNQIEKIQNIRETNKLNDTIISELKNIEIEIFNRRNRLRFINFGISSGSKNTINAIINSNGNIVDSLKPNKDSLDNKIKTYNRDNPIRVKSARNWKVDLITSSFSFLLMIVLLPFIPFFNTKDFWQTLLGAIILMVILILITWGNYNLFVLIPVIWEPWVNYVLNSALHTIVVVLFVKFMNRKS